MKHGKIPDARESIAEASAGGLQISEKQDLL